jgi:hypothetical protein
MGRLAYGELVPLVDQRPFTEELRLEATYVVARHPCRVGARASAAASRSDAVTRNWRQKSNASLSGAYPRGAHQPTKRGEVRGRLPPMGLT